MASSPEPLSALESSAGGAAARLAEQLHSLAAVSETLTYRLLELEERVLAQEQRFGALEGAHSEAGVASAGVISGRLEETEQRLERIETLLAGLERGGAGRRLQAIEPISALRPGDRAEGPSPMLVEGENEPEDPFYEEGEQPFMDERTA